MPLVFLFFSSVAYSSSSVFVIPSFFCLFLIPSSYTQVVNKMKAHTLAPKIALPRWTVLHVGAALVIYPEFF